MVFFFYFVQIDDESRTFKETHKLLFVRSLDFGPVRKVSTASDSKTRDLLEIWVSSSSTFPSRARQAIEHRVGGRVIIEIYSLEAFETGETRGALEPSRVKE